MKVRINNLPKGFTLKNGRVSKGKAFGGSHTGDQESFGLTTIPSPYTTDITGTENRNPFSDVNTTLGPVPREEANLEAEVGETVLTDMNNDGDFELYNIGGKRHHKGGTPLNLPPQSFIYSDTASMKFDEFELAELGIESKKKLTPAHVSKNYQLNKYYSVLNNEHSDKIAKNTSEYMLQKNKESLSQLAFLQEAKKDFKDGVPLASYPYLHKQGINPIEFSMKMEGLTKKEAEQKALMQLPIEDREKIMQLQEILKQAQASQGPTQGSPQGMPPMGPPQQQMMPPQEMMAQGPPQQMMAPQQMMPAQQPMAIPMAKFGGALPTFQGDDGSSEVSIEDLQNKSNQIQQQINLMSDYNNLLLDVNNAQNNYLQFIENQNNINSSEQVNNDERIKNEAYNEMISNKDYVTDEKAFNASVKNWITHIEAGGSPPDTDIPAYNEAYKQVYGEEYAAKKVNDATNTTKEIITKIVEKQVNAANQSNKNNEEYEKYMQQQMLKNFYLNQDKTDGNTTEPVYAQGYPLEWTNKQDPYYVGSEFATGDTLETMRYGGSVKELKRFDEGGDVSIDSNSFPIVLRNENGEAVYTISNNSELEKLKTSDPGAYNFITSQYASRNTGTSGGNVPTRSASAETKKTYKGFDSWSEWYMSPQAKEYRNKRYQAYKIVAESENITPLSADEYHSGYSNYMRESDAFNTLAEQDPLFRDNPNWDSGYEWEISDTPCEEGEGGCKEYAGNTWRTVGAERKDNSWHYREQQQALNLTDANGNPIEPMTDDMIQHMQIGMNSGIILQNTGQDADTYNAPVNFDIYENQDGEQVDPLTGASKSDSWAGNNTMFNTEGTYDIVPAEGCTNAAEIEQQCTANGGTFIPWDSVAQTGCTCEMPEEVPEIPVGEVGPPADPPTPAFWLQDELALANAMDAKTSIDMDLPWAPRYNANLIDPVFKDPTREIAAIQEGAKLVADSANAFSGPQRAMAVTLKAQGNAAKQIADTVNRVHSDNITIANTVNAKNAEILYKTQVLNHNETKQLYDNTNRAKQNYRDSLRKANKEITSKLMNAYTNMANTYNLNTLYDQFNMHPETGGFVNYNQQADPFYDDPSALQDSDPGKAYIEWYENMLKMGIPSTHIPKFEDWPGNKSNNQGTTQDDIRNAITQGGYGREGKETRSMRLARKGMELRDFLNE
jgi:hypothetical protein